MRTFQQNAGCSLKSQAASDKNDLTLNQLIGENTTIAFFGKATVNSCTSNFILCRTTLVSPGHSGKVLKEHFMQCNS